MVAGGTFFAEKIEIFLKKDLQIQKRFVILHRKQKTTTTMNAKNNATFHFGNIEAKADFLANRPKYIAIIEDLGGCDIILNIGNLAKFLKARPFINADIYFA